MKSEGAGDVSQYFRTVVGRNSRESLADIPLQNLRGPDTELGCTLGVDAIADGDDGIEAVVLEGPSDGPSSF